MEPAALKDMVSDVLSRLCCSVESIEVGSGPRVVVAITSPDHAALIGAGGEHLQALNTIVRRMAEKAHGAEAANFLIDINRFHEDRLKALRDRASMLAQRVRLFKHEVEMDPMNSYERLVVHELFAEDPEIETASSGESKMRHVVLRYKK